MKELKHQIKRTSIAYGLEQTLLSLANGAQKNVNNENYQPAIDKLETFSQTAIYANGLSYHQKQALLEKIYELLALLEDV